jgi:hypothetical protein
VAASLVLAGCGQAVSMASPEPSRPAPTATPSPSPTRSPRPTPSPSPTPEVTADLTGLPADPSIAHRLPIAVMIDDNRVARPQSGFNAADVVFQSLADGFESRYMFVYASTDAADIGPVRSARPFLVHWAEEWRSTIAHFGGDPISLAHIRSADGQTLTSIDGITAAGGGAYHRIRSRPRPHNAYTSTDILRTAAGGRGAPDEMPAGVFRRAFVDPDPDAAAGRSQSIRVPYRTANVTYEYEPATNRYLRSIDGRPHVDPADGEQVGPTNVVILFQRFRIDTRIEPGHSRPVIDLVGTGRALVLSEGVATEATWSKADETGPTMLLDADGDEVPLIHIAAP